MFIFQRKMKANVGEGKEEYKNVWLDYVSLDFLIIGLVNIYLEN